MCHKSGKQNFERKIVINFLPISLNICFGYSKEPSHWDGSFKHPKHMFETMGKKTYTIERWKILLN